MHAWIKDDKIHFILPSEHEPEAMGPIYRLSFEDAETLDDARSLAAAARLNVEMLERRIIRKLQREQ